MPASAAGNGDETSARSRSASGPVDELPVEDRQIASVLRDHRPSISDSRIEHVRVGQRPQLGAFRDGEHVKGLAAQRLSDMAILLLVEQQPQRRAAAFWRSDAAATR